VSRLQLKWPNDVLLNGAKVAGILLEAVTEPARPPKVVIGIGVNVRTPPSGVSYPAASLAENGIAVSADALFAALSDAWIDQERLWNDGSGFAAIRGDWLKRAAGVGGPISVSMGDDIVRGIFETIDENGRLIIRSGDGSRRAISAGEVHFGAAATVSP